MSEEEDAERLAEEAAAEMAVLAEAMGGEDEDI